MENDTTVDTVTTDSSTQYSPAAKSEAERTALLYCLIIIVFYIVASIILLIKYIRSETDETDAKHVSYNSEVKKFISHGDLMQHRKHRYQARFFKRDECSNCSYNKLKPPKRQNHVSQTPSVDSVREEEEDEESAKDDCLAPPAEQEKNNFEEVFRTNTSRTT